MDSTVLQEQLVTLLGTVLALGTAYLMKLARDFLKKQGEIQDAKLSKEQRDALYPALQYAVDYGRSTLTQDQAGQLAASDKLKNHVVAEASRYINSKMPDTLAKLGVSESDLQELLRARLQAALEWARVNIKSKG